MAGLPLDVWIMMLFSAAVFFGGSIGMLVYTLRQEERKMRILEDEHALDSYSPAALRDLQHWVDEHPDDPDVQVARTRHQECVDAVRNTNRHVYQWTDADRSTLLS
jgi:hypothetical protein